MTEGAPWPVEIRLLSAEYWARSPSTGASAASASVSAGSGVIGREQLAISCISHGDEPHFAPVRRQQWS